MWFECTILIEVSMMNNDFRNKYLNMNIKNGKISVIIPAYNAEKTIERCLNSVIKQSYPNLEVIVVDDGSKDRTLSIANETAKHDRRIKVMSKQNGGAASARNVGLKMASGEFITFLDADDYIETDVYMELCRAQKENNLDIVSASIREIYKGDICEERTNPDGVIVSTGEVALCNMFSYRGGVRTVVWDKLYKRSIIHNITFSESCLYGEDTLFNCETILRCKRYGTIPYIGYTYDHRESQMTGEEYNSSILSNLSVIEKMETIIEQNNCHRYSKEHIDNCLVTYKISMYRQLFQSMLMAKHCKKVKSDYKVLREWSMKISYRDIKSNLGLKHRIQWKIYIHFFELYRVIRLLKSLRELKDSGKN